MKLGEMKPQGYNKVDVERLTIGCAVMVVESEPEEFSDSDRIQAWQYLIETNVVWELQGWFGRTARTLIDNGICYFERSTL